jgi:hypothetical protein
MFSSGRASRLHSFVLHTRGLPISPVVKGPTKPNRVPPDLLEHDYHRKRSIALVAVASGAGAGAPLFPGHKEERICPTRDGAIPYAEAGSW